MCIHDKHHSSVPAERCGNMDFYVKKSGDNHIILSLVVLYKADLR